MPEATTVNPAIEQFVNSLQRNFAVIKRNTEGIDHEQSLLTFQAGSSHLNWLYGHLITYRDAMLRALGSETVWDKETGAQYGWGSAPADAMAARPLEELQASLHRSQDLLVQALNNVTEDELQVEQGDRTVFDRLQFLVWHDTYHSGQTALYRRLAGLDSALG
jgi:uncharacterized damage-inducible protein DinB